MERPIQHIQTLATEAYKAGLLEQAEKLFEIVASSCLSDPISCSFLGLIAMQRLIPQAAVRHFSEAVRRDPGNPLHHANLAGALLQTKQFEEALLAANQALALNPHYPAALLSGGSALLSLGKNQESHMLLERLIQLDPQHVEGLVALGEVLMRLSAFDEAEKKLRQALALYPSHLEALFHLAICLFQTRRNNEASAACEQILKINPKHLAAHFLRCFAHLPFIYKNEHEMAAIRARYEQDLLVLRDLCKQSSNTELSQAICCLGLAQPFYLAYQGYNDRILQSIYGDIVELFTTARFPKWKKKLPLRKRASTDRIRIGIVSGFFQLHSNWKAPLNGWIKRIDRKAFAVFGYDTCGKISEITEEARKYLEQFTMGPKTLKEFYTVIRNDDLDVLIYPEIGMDPMTMRLASLRLAPVQCTSWGHPDTSGLQTIDYFLSSALMEPIDGEEYYTEKLIRLPNLSIYYEPLPSSPRKTTRGDFGLREDAVLYWCCQIPTKYHPIYDTVFAKIALKVPEAQFVFIESLPMIAQEFRHRLEKAFAQFDLQAKEHCVFLPKLTSQEFDEATGLMDIFLDSLGWSGFNSTLESLPHNLPIVTLPGKTMRSRHTSAILTMMGMEKSIATSEDDYLTRAILLGNQVEERLQMRAQIASRKHLVYRDDTAIKGLEEFLKKMVR